MKYFKRSEFACKCGCGFDTIDHELARVLDSLREVMKNPITVTSGCRCSVHNAVIGGADRSRHVIGQAADIKVLNTHPAIVFKYLDKTYPDKYGLGLYNGWVHIDVRPEKARWNKT